MKTKLLLLALCASFMGYAQTFDNIPTGTGIYLNKVIPSPNTDDLTNEYFEFRGTPNAIVPEDLYFIMVEGDGESGKDDMGKVKEAVQLGNGTRTFGSNGILALVANYTNTTSTVVTTNPYTAVISSNATIITIELEGTDVTSSSSSAVDSQTPDIGYDGNFTDASASYMLISSSDGSPKNPKNHDFDTDDDGIIDAIGDHTTEWVLYDSVAYLDIDDPVAGTETGEYGYAQVVFARTYDDTPANFKITTSATIINQGTSNISYMMRQGNKTGFGAGDWIGASNGGGSLPPNWTFSSTSSKVHPDEFLEYVMPNSIYGELNPTAETLSSNDVLASNFSIYPNPSKDYIQIESKDVKISSVDMYSIVGQKVLSTKTLVNSRLNIANLTSGIYLLKVNSPNGSLTKKIIVE